MQRIWSRGAPHILHFMWEWAPTEPSAKSLYMFIDGVTPPNAETETPRTLTGSVAQIQLEVMWRVPRNSSGFETVKMEFLKSQNLKTSLILSGCRSAEVIKRRWRGYSVRAAESLIRYVTCVTFRDFTRQNHRRDDFWRAVCVSGQGMSLPEVEMSKSRSFMRSPYEDLSCCWAGLTLTVKKK
ncbi:hypothetical protein C8R45DRAFT_926878 [Mycena sanguinolenta]|nr:hypothetical protein C8R45DRAFT_926878 [Mycena sanguinolenta]